MNLLQRLRRTTSRSSITTVEDYLAAVETFGFGGNIYGLGQDPFTTTMGREQAERSPVDFRGMATQMFGQNSVIFACMLARFSVFSAARFQYQRFNAGRPSELFGDQTLGMLERPWEGGTTQDLLARMLIDADLAGNSYWTVYQGELIRLRPDWVDIVCEPRVVGPPTERGPQVMGWRKLGFLYHEGGRGETEPVPLLYRDVAHYAPIPDPLASYRGMSWLTPLIREASADELMTRYKRRLMENSASPNMIIKHDPSTTLEQIRKFREFFNAEHAGPENVGKTMHLGGGAEPMVVGANFQELEFATVQAHGETRIAAAAGVPPVIAGLSKGLESATYSNYGQARRRFADGTLHPLWRNACGTMEQIRKAPAGCRLWYDSRDIEFLREDEKDAAEIAEIQARTMRVLIDGGYDPESVSKFMAAGATDWALLRHSGLLSVQLQPPGTVATPPAAAAAPAKTPAEKTPAKTPDKTPAKATPAASPSNNGKRSEEAFHA